MKKKTLQIVITIPKLFIEGDYKTNSQLAVVTVKGEGPFTANLTKVTGDGRATIKAVCKDIAGYDTKQQVMMVENAKFDFNIGTPYLKYLCVCCILDICDILDFLNLRYILLQLNLP